MEILHLYSPLSSCTLIYLSFYLLSFILALHLHSLFVYKEPISVLKKAFSWSKKGVVKKMLGHFAPDPLSFTFRSGAIAPPPRDFSG